MECSLSNNENGFVGSLAHLIFVSSTLAVGYARSRYLHRRPDERSRSVGRRVARG